MEIWSRTGPKIDSKIRRQWRSGPELVPKLTQQFVASGDLVQNWSLPASQPACQPASQPACQPACLPACQPASLPASQPACQPASQPACLPSLGPKLAGTSSGPDLHWRRIFESILGPVLDQISTGDEFLSQFWDQFGPVQARANHSLPRLLAPSLRHVGPMCEALSFLDVCS